MIAGTMARATRAMFAMLPGGVILDLDDLIFGAKYALAKRAETQPSELWLWLKQAIIEVESVDIDNRSHKGLFGGNMIKQRPLGSPLTAFGPVARHGRVGF